MERVIFVARKGHIKIIVYKLHL